MEITRDDRELRKNIFIVMLLFALAWVTCRYSGDKTNSYTQYHKTITEGFFGTVTSLLAFWIVKETFYFLGKPRNELLYMIIEPICILIRVTLLLTFCRFILLDMTLPMLNNWFFAVKHNWWKHDNEPFITNNSFINAFFCWFICSFLWFFVVWCVLFGLICLRDQNYKF